MAHLQEAPFEGIVVRMSQLLLPAVITSPLPPAAVRGLCQLLEPLLQLVRADLGLVLPAGAVCACVCVRKVKVKKHKEQLKERVSVSDLYICLLNVLNASLAAHSKHKHNETRETKQRLERTLLGGV